MIQQSSISRGSSIGGR